ncbi:MAG: methylenetetrahydrofolate reductase C-terminal domain-containing protein [Polyangiaceae bacterium]|nr:methylenetetrahydrofolate reductase C-terminal domain-containing protein [Polyangiaceae bacterium]
MIVAERKPVSEIRDLIAPHDRVLFLGCGTCVTVCMAGGAREVSLMAAVVRMAAELGGRTGLVIEEATVERQCEILFLDPIAEQAAGYDAICSFGCGAGVQHVAARLPQTPVHPGLDTQFLGVLEGDGVWAERCAGCGSCRLAEFSGLCPIARCAKRLLNGPCGGSQVGRCEIDPALPCAWQLIYERARAVGALDRLQGVAEVQEWGKALDGGPRRVVRGDQSIADLRR